MAKKYFSFQEKQKRLEGKCVICGESDYALLDCHRIIPGEEGGTYNVRNTAVLCANCHRKSHTGRIVFEGKWYTSAAKWIIYYREDGVEKHTDIHR